MAGRMKAEYPRGRAPKTHVSWTPSMDAEIIRLWNAGKITREIAAVIPGTTRNAILGRLHRLRINGADIKPRMPSRRNFLAGKTPKPRVRATTLPAKDKSPSVAFPESGKRIPKIPKVLPKPKIIPTGNLCSIVDLTGCKWPVTADPTIPGKHLFCNAARAVTKPYCENHQALAWRARS